VDRRRTMEALEEAVEARQELMQAWVEEEEEEELHSKSEVEVEELEGHFHSCRQERVVQVVM